MIRLHRRYRFSASHLYRRSEWTEEQNRRHFGKCANLPGHGHNYRLWISVSGEVDPETGFVVDLGKLDEVVARRVLDVVDHQHLNSAVPVFAERGLIPSSENLVVWIRDEVRDELGDTLIGVRVDEDDDLGAEWSRQES